MAFRVKTNVTLVIAALATIAGAGAAHAKVKGHSVSGWATTEPLACRAANRTAKIGFKDGEIKSTSPCRCTKQRENHFQCDIDITYEVKE